jgi:hypothetical protein
MSDPVTLLVPTDERFRAIGPELAGKYCAAQGGSDGDAATVVEAVTTAVQALTDTADRGADVTMDLRTVPGNVEVTLRCCGRSSVVTHALPSTRAAR